MPSARLTARKRAAARLENASIHSQNSYPPRIPVILGRLEAHVDWYGFRLVAGIRTDRVTERGLVVVPSAALDLASVPCLRTAIEDAQAVVASVVLDLSEVSFIDSSIVGVIASANKDVARLEAGSQLVVVSPPGSHPRRVLDMVKAETFVRVYDDRTAALTAIGWNNGEPS